jgi:hypothetical protein
VLVRKATNTTTTVQDGPSNVLVWTLVQKYGALSTFTWQPSAGEEGTYAVQVRVRSVGSGVAMQASRSIVNVVITAGP